MDDGLLGCGAYCAALIVGLAAVICLVYALIWLIVKLF